MAAEKENKETKTKKLADPVAATIDIASRQMIERAHELGIETAFDRAVTMKPCNIGTQGICCKNCGMGPCRLPLPKGGIEGEDTRKGICGATPNTIAARNFIRMIAGGAAAHSDHGRSVAEVFMSAARKETDAYKIKDTRKLIEVAHWLGVDTTVEVDGKQLDRDIDEIAVEVGEKALNEWGKAEGELLFAKRAPEARYEIWKKQGVVPRNIDREIVEIMHRTHIGVDQDYKNLMKQGTRAAIADGWGGSMLATDLQDILFGTPYPVASEANLGVMKEDMVNIVIHGHEPVLSEMIVAVVQTREMEEYAKSKGAKGIQLSGICCTANEMLQRHGVPLCGTFLQRVHRLWKQESLRVPKRARKRLQGTSGENACDRRKAMHRNDVWTLDFAWDVTEQGCQLKFLPIVDEFTRECLAISVATSIKSTDIQDLLERLFEEYGMPNHIRCDNGPEMTAEELRRWLKRRGVAPLFIAPASPWENGYGESFIGRLRDEHLDRELFTSLLEAQVVTEDWRIEYNTYRPHGALGLETPSEFAASCIQAALAPLEQPGCTRELEESLT